MQGESYVDREYMYQYAYVCICTTHTPAVFKNFSWHTYTRYAFIQIYHSIMLDLLTIGGTRVETHDPPQVHLNSQRNATTTYSFKKIRCKFKYTSICIYYIFIYIGRWFI